jgi:exopolysaccharide biosynthesis polyprenyl glycosylphosphotransferase
MSGFADESAAPLRPATTAAPPAPARHAGLLERGRVRILMGADMVAMGAAIALAYGVAHLIAPPAITAPNGAAIGLVAAGWLGWAAIFAAYQLYERESRAIAPSSFDEVALLFHALLAGNLAYLLAAQVLKRVADVSVYTPVESVLLLGFAVVLVPCARAAVRGWLLPAVMRPRRTLIVGAGREGRRLERKLSSHPDLGLELVGFLDEPGSAPDILGTPEDLTRLVEELEVDWVILASSGAPHESVLDAVRAVRRPDVQLSIVPTYAELFASNALIEDLEGMPLVSLPSMRLSRSVRALKRGVDVAGAGLGLLLLSPLLAVIAIAIKLDSPGPVLFRQRRSGRGGSTFPIAKFRTMRDGAEAERFELAAHNELTEGGPLFKIHADPRITRIGGFLRRYSLDELPQLWNVVRGDMSLVGPRPFVIHEARQITGWAERRLDITPGITGLWQVSGRNDIPFEEMVKLDYVYVTNWSLWWDVKILFQTIPVVFARRGAY